VAAIYKLESLFFLQGLFNAMDINSFQGMKEITVFVDFDVLM